MLRRIGVTVAFAAALAAPAGAAPATDLARWAGEAPPLFDLETLDGGRVSLGDHQGGAVLVHFFATWCAPCIEELPALDRLAERRGEGLKVLAVDVREPGPRVRRFFAERPVGFAVLLDRDGAVTRSWGVEVLPGSVVLGPGLAPVFRAVGEVDWDHPDVEARLDEAIGTMPGG